MQTEIAAHVLNKCSSNGSLLNKEEIIEVLSWQDEALLERLFQIADDIRKNQCGDDVHLRALIEFSNHCSRNCLYCGIRRGNKKLERYRMTPDEIVDTAVKACSAGFKTIVLQSGEDTWFAADKVSWIVKAIKDRAGCAITLCIGERTLAEYEVMKKAGADRYLIKYETANPDLYHALHPEMDYENRINILLWLKEMGYQVGGGNMVGLPGQTLEDLADDIILARKLNLDMMGIGPFIPHSETPLHDFPGGDLKMVLKTVAVSRIVTLNSHIPATTATGTIDAEGRQKALRCGANVIMPNLTPAKYRKLYEIYPGKKCSDEEPGRCAGCIKTMVKSMGRNIAPDYGHSLKN
ncbi:MAG: [FeFe] hydrogenase H-cluster radical SAM maturase HydE [Firmicutes bacterium]|nr:[FeFe] hydrogenase H-cluster radical SAM maturase HydE [Bacillota bacterium]